MANDVKKGASKDPSNTQISNMQFRYKILRESLGFEFQFWKKKTPALSLLKGFAFCVLTLLASYNDASGLLGSDLAQKIPPIKKVIELIGLPKLTAGIILLLSALQFLFDYNKSDKLNTIVSNHIVPAVSSQLTSLRKTIADLIKAPAKDLRICLFVPIRIGLFKWRLKIVCNTDNVSRAEVEAQFELDEGAIGYLFIKTQNHGSEAIEIITPGSLVPKVYKDLSKDNQNLIRKDILAVTGAGSRTKAGTLGFVCVDTNNSLTASKLKAFSARDPRLEWIVEHQAEIDLLWKMLNKL